MPLERPTLREIEARERADMKLHLPNADPELRRGNLQVLSRVDAGAVHALYGLARMLSKQIMADTADHEYLERHSSIYGISRKPASTAVGQVKFNGKDGSVIPEGLELRRADDLRYLTTSQAVINNGEALVSVKAKEPGVNGNVEPDTGITAYTIIDGVTPRGKAVTIAGGADPESDESLRRRLLSRIQMPPQGGALHDYEAWALEVPGVTRAWPYPLRMGPGTVGLTFLMDNQEGTPIPPPEKVQLVQDHLDAPDIKPVCAQVHVFACQAQPVNFDIRLHTIDTAQVRAAVQESLELLFRYEAEPEKPLLISHIREAISQAAGEYDHELILPTANIQAETGKILTLGSINWEA